MNREELLKTAKPILFNTDMVRAILESRKVVTRRLLKPQPKTIYYDGKVYDDDGLYVIAEKQNGGVEQIELPYRPNDILYVRETWYYETFYEDTDNLPDLPSGNRSWRYVYKADNQDYPVIPGHWHPSIHMPREAARIFLCVKDVSVGRIQSMLPCDIQKEGCPYIYSSFDEEQVPDWFGWMKNVWDSTIKSANRAVYGWDANPWVWVIEFEKIEVSDNA